MQFKKKDVNLADVYGAEHLVRLFVKLPELVAVPMMALPEDAKYILTVEEHIEDLMGYMIDSRHKDRLFASSGEYQGGMQKAVKSEYQPDGMNEMKTEPATKMENDTEN